MKSGHTQEDMYMSYGSDQTISLATGYKQNVSDAPAIASVVTEQQIKSSGATTIGEVLKRVVGVHVTKNRVYDDIFVFRSIYNELNPHVLFMIDGVSIGDVAQGGRPLGWTYPVNNIYRIEIIRGPSSALYGADAFAGTVNIITKTGAKGAQQPVEVGAGGGSFDTVGAWAIGGIENDWFDLSGYAEFRVTNGHEKLVEIDAQSSIDAIMGTQASLAPGAINTGRKDAIMQLDLKMGDWHWRAGYQGVLNKESGVGSNHALDTEGDMDMNLLTVDGAYDKIINDDLLLKAKISFSHQKFDSFFQVFPPGAFGLFTDGVLNQVSFELNDLRTALEFQYDGLSDNTVSGGGGFIYQEALNSFEKRNFIQTPNGSLIPTGRLIDTRELGESPAGFDSDRTNFFVFIQDEWNFANDWALTAGVRIDKYSSFNIAVNPKASLVWNISPSLTAKLLYGRAFRAPTFLESTEGMSRAARGNSELQPEFIDTGEIGLIQNWNRYQSTRINAYYYETKDVVAIVPDSVTTVPTFINTDGSRGYGFEVEHDMELASTLTVRMNYAFQKAEAKSSNTPIGLTPEHQAYVESEWQFIPGWYVDMSIKYVGERERGRGDPRGALDDYVWSDLVLRYEPYPKKELSCIFAVKNLFDSDAREPTDFLVPNDIPLPDRYFVGTLRYKF